MKKIVSIILLAFSCICGYAQTIAPALLEEMGQRRDNEKIRVFVIMRQQYDQQQLNLRATHFTSRAERRDFVVTELKQFAEASQYDLRHSLSEMQRNGLVTEPKMLWIANAISFEATREAILSLADRSDIMVIDFDKERYCIPDGEESQPAYPTREITSNVTQVNADQVWNLGYTGQGVVVAVIDTGVNYNHLDLADHLWDGGAEFPHHGYDVINNDNDPMDDHGHGTHCAGTVCGDGTAGSQTGMAPDATLMCVKCMDSSAHCSNTDVINAMQWSVDHGCDVISMSIVGHGHYIWEQTLIRNACVNVLNAGVIASFAAGNEGGELSQYPIPENIGLPGGCPPPYLDPEQALNPGGLSCSVCVGAVDSNDQAADFTSHGPRDWSESDYSDYPYTPGSQWEFGLIRPDVCAPGVSIKSANYKSNNGYKYMSGTSMAAPCVAGCMALMLSKDPDATPADLCRFLEETAVPLSTGKSNIYGCGRVDALAAVMRSNYDFSAVCSTGQRLYYNIIDVTNHYVEITYPGEDSNPWGGFTQPTGNITLPSTVTYNGVTYTVTKIGDDAFRSCNDLTGSLTIPNSVTSIGQYAFFHCTGFTGSLTLGNSVTSIGTGTFKNCSGFTQVNYKAVNCADVTYTDKPFEGCGGTLTIGSTVQRIPAKMFYDCTGFTGSLSIPNSVTSIGDYAFSYCSGFNGGLTLGNSVTVIGEHAFYFCEGFNGSLTIPNSVTTIGNYAFGGCSGFTGSLTLGNSVTSIGDAAFGACSGFTGSLTIPNTVTTIGAGAFQICHGFTGSLIIPNSVATIGNIAFYNCDGFTGLTIGTGVASIGMSAFKNCSGITQVNYNAVNCADVASADKPFEGCSCTLTIGSAVQRIPAYMFYNCTGFTGTLTIPNSVTTIGNYAFYHCKFTGNLDIPDAVTEIGAGTFSEVTFTGTLTLGNSLTTIGDEAFQSCEELRGPLVIPNSVVSIGFEAFQYCYGFSSLTIGSSVTTIDGWAFYECLGMASITVLPETPPALHQHAFYHMPNSIPLYVPCASLETYQAASYWSAFTNIQCFPETLTVYDGTATSLYVPAYIYFFDNYARSQFVIPAEDLVEMTGNPIVSMTFYTTDLNVPYTTVSYADIYVKEVDYVSINAYEPKESATTVFSGQFTIVRTSSGGETTIHFNTPYIYNGGNLLVGIENTDDYAYKKIYFYGQTVSGASIAGSNSSSTGTIPATQRNFIPKTTFSFLPACDAESLPYTCGFEEGDGFGCWTMLNCDEYTGIHQNAKRTGNNGFRFRWNTNPPQYLISPEFEGTSAMVLSFYYKNAGNNYPETFQVGYSTTTKSPNAFTWSDEVTANDPTTWMLYEDNFPVGTKYVAVKLTSNDQYYLYLDDFSFTTPYCPEPTNLTVTDITSNSAEVHWTGEQDNYNVRYRTVPDGSWIVKTPQLNSFMDDFENGLDQWTLIDADGDGRSWDYGQISGGSPHGGTKMAFSFSWYGGHALTPDNYLVTPCVNLGGTVTFWASAENLADAAEHFGIAVSTGSSINPSDFTMVQEWTMQAKGGDQGGPRGNRAQGTWYQYTADLSAYAGQTGYIALRHFDCTDQFALAVDDFSYDAGGIPSGVTLMGLNPATTYEVQVQGICPYGLTEWSEPVTFTTAPTVVTQTIALSAGWNWISTYIDLNEVDGITMLEEALGDYGVTIQTYNESADYFGDGEWSGLEEYGWTNAEMIMIEVSEDCTIDLAGPTVDPSTVEIEIHSGWNWIGFPVATETAIGVAMAGFEAEEEDAIQSNVDGTSDYLDEWVGDVLTLVPGQGYMYYSNSTEPKTLVFSTTTKGKSVFSRKHKE